MIQNTQIIIVSESIDIEIDKNNICILNIIEVNYIYIYIYIFNYNNNFNKRMNYMNSHQYKNA
jgi:hypothetical protein